jgi:predicted nucleic acid-binding protein
MAKPRRLWDASVIIDYLKGTGEAGVCDDIIEHAGKGDLEIAVSMLAHAEVAKVDGSERDEGLIQEFFSRPYVISIAVTRQVTAEARRLVRDGLVKRSADAIHAATALVYKIPILETTDLDDFKSVNGVGEPPLEVRKPVPFGPPRLF